ncbi:alpha/beta hydrolase [Aldersonia sp. NBC_00410]|uniref:alpha/beta fold hydrolase n=1 Tax=Aldersonia sp. NBC_00410 TaxID=2975954 RepID=UPI002251F0C7|nr:alpha/beta hydrolase [Aldersonia sp. NBC_00410]MCX5042592.1 alpha/beta hydrolase [Aldersonia sp. NBC_00410]
MDDSRSPAPLRSVRSEPQLTFRTIHGYRRAVRIAGEGPPIVLLHGIGDNSLTWAEVMADLSTSYTVIAPDMLGHGRSDKPRADYSVAAYANGLRDLLTVLGYDRVTVIGHSLGGGVATQFSYQFPEMVERVILVGAGGVSKEVHAVLRVATAPLISSGLRVLQLPGATRALAALGSAIAQRVATSPVGRSTAGHDAVDIVRVLDGFADNTGYLAFLRTLRAAVDWRGQVITMLDRCYLYEQVPVQIIWGGCDAVIPVSHAHLAHAAIPGSQLEIFAGAGHFPFRDEPERFIEVVRKFVDSTDAAAFDPSRRRALLATGSGESHVTGTSMERRAAVAVMDATERSAT